MAKCYQAYKCGMTINIVNVRKTDADAFQSTGNLGLINDGGVKCVTIDYETDFESSEFFAVVDSGFDTCPTCVAAHEG